MGAGLRHLLLRFWSLRETCVKVPGARAAPDPGGWSRGRVSGLRGPGAGVDSARGGSSPTLGSLSRCVRSSRGPGALVCISAHSVLQFLRGYKVNTGCV